MTGGTRYVVDFAWVAPDGLLWTGIPQETFPWGLVIADPDTKPGVRSYQSLKAMQTGVAGVLGSLQLLKGQPVAVVYDKDEDRHWLYGPEGQLQEVPWDWGKWPPHIRAAMSRDAES